MDTYFYCDSCQVEIPLLSAHQMKISGAGSKSGPVSPRDKTEKSPVNPKFLCRDEVLNRTYKFLGVIDATLQHLQIQGLFI